MKNLIYQYWDGEIPLGGKAGIKNMENYAKRIGAEYLFEHNPKFVTNLGTYSPHYGSFKPIYTDKYLEYDNVLYCDIDVFAVKNLIENIFDNFTGDLGLCTEPLQPALRLDNKQVGQINHTMDEKWAGVIEKKWSVTMPRNKEGLLKVYNSGVVMYSNKGLVKARKNFKSFQEYVNLITSNKIAVFYTADQNYLHAMLKVANLNYMELPSEWNTYVHYLGSPNKSPRPISDPRNLNTKFVHIQLRSADHYDENKLYRITNLSQSEWNL